MDGMVYSASHPVTMARNLAVNPTSSFIVRWSISGVRGSGSIRILVFVPEAIALSITSCMAFPLAPLVGIPTRSKDRVRPVILPKARVLSERLGAIRFPHAAAKYTGKLDTLEYAGMKRRTQDFHSWPFLPAETPGLRNPPRIEIANSLDLRVLYSARVGEEVKLR